MRLANAKFKFWRKRHIPDRRFLLILSVPIGILAGLSAIILKNLTHIIRDWCFSFASHNDGEDYMFFIFPFVGILLTLLVVRFVIRKNVGHGIPGLLYAISKGKGRVDGHTTYSSIITSILTVGFGGSVGLEGPSVSTGGSIGSYIGQILGLSQKQITTLIGMGGAAALAAIFQAPITGVIFTMEVFMIDISMVALVPIIISSFVAILTSYYILGNTVEYNIVLEEAFIPSNSLYYIGLGLFVGLISAYFMFVYFRMGKAFKRIESQWWRFIIGSLALGFLIFLFPSLYGEGYEGINAALNDNLNDIFSHSAFSAVSDTTWFFIILTLVVILLKAFATSFTFAAGGVGGTFAPALFIGSFSGMLFATTINMLGIGSLNVGKFALVGMGGVVAGMLHAPLTGVFLIAEITNGYSLMVPLLIVAAISYSINRLFFKDSIYTRPVTEAGVTFTHNKDVNILCMMDMSDLIEDNFNIVKPKQTMRELVEIISQSTRNIYPVIDDDGIFRGHVLFDDIRSVIFNQDIYDTPVEDLMVMPQYIIHPADPMDEIVKKFDESNKYNIPVIEDGKYLGYISRAKFFTTYQTTLKSITDEE